MSNDSLAPDEVALSKTLTKAIMKHISSSLIVPNAETIGISSKTLHIRYRIHHRHHQKRNKKETSKRNQSITQSNGEREASRVPPKLRIHYRRASLPSGNSTVLDNDERSMDDSSHCSSYFSSSLSSTSSLNSSSSRSTDSYSSESSGLSESSFTNESQTDYSTSDTSFYHPQLKNGKACSFAHVSVTPLPPDRLLASSVTKDRPPSWAIPAPTLPSPAQPSALERHAPPPPTPQSPSRSLVPYGLSLPPHPSLLPDPPLSSMQQRTRSHIPSMPTEMKQHFEKNG